MHISRFGDGDKQPKIRQSIVHFSRRWATVITPDMALRRASGTNRWSHGGGLFTDPRTGEQFILQAIWPIVDEPELWIEDPDPDSEDDFAWSAPRIKTDNDAAQRIESLEGAERHKRTRERLRPKATDGRLSIRLMVEYGVDWPLWGDEGHLEPWELGLSAGLTERLRAWNELWESSHDYGVGWKTRDAQTRFKRGEAMLAADLGREVQSFADVEPFEN